MQSYNFDFSKKIFYQPEKIVRFKEGKRPFPHTLELDLTNRCNHRCVFCNFKTHLKKSRAVLESNLITKRMAEAYDLGTRGICITGGGEPTLHREFVPLIQRFRAIGFDLGLITNGSLMAGKEPYLIENLQWIRISMGGGDRQSYRAAEGVDHFEKLIQNIYALSERKRFAHSRLNIGIRILVTQANLESLGNIAAILRDGAINYLQLAPDQFSEPAKARFWHSQKTRAVFAEVEKILEPAGVKLLRSGFSITPQNLDFPRMCYAHFFHIAITAEGDLMFCKNARGNMRKGDEFVFGNIHANSLQEIWNGSRVKEMEARIRPNNCGYFCKNFALNAALEETLFPDEDMSPNFVS